MYISSSSVNSPPHSFPSHSFVLGKMLTVRGKVPRENGLSSSRQPWGQGPTGPREGHDPTSEGRPHGEIVVLHSEKWPRFSFPDFGHVDKVLLIKVTAKTSKRCFSTALQGTE